MIISGTSHIAFKLLLITTWQADSDAMWSQKIGGRKCSFLSQRWHNPRAYYSTGSTDNTSGNRGLGLWETDGSPSVLFTWATKCVFLSEPLTFMWKQWCYISIPTWCLIQLCPVISWKLERFASPITHLLLYHLRITGAPDKFLSLYIHEIIKAWVPALAYKRIKLFIYPVRRCITLKCMYLTSGKRLS